jgi:L-lactate dehydrogenase (cytochrome)
MTKPRWCLGMLGTKRHGFGNIVGHVKGVENMGSLSEWTAKQFDPALNWGDVAWIKKRWGGKLILKGIQDVEDARNSPPTPAPTRSSSPTTAAASSTARCPPSPPCPRSSTPSATRSKCTWTAASAPARTC